MSNELPDKDFLYGKFQAWEDWRNRLHRKLAHKSLDIADGEDVNVDNSRTGLDWKGLAVIAAAVGASALGGMYLGNSQTADTQPNVQTDVQQVLDSN